MKAKNRKATDNRAYHDRYSSQTNKKVSKTDWAGVGLGDAFKRNVDYYTRLSAQRSFYEQARQYLERAVEAAGPRGDKDRPKIKPQIGPCYSNYPAALSVPAALGLTGYLEFRQRVASDILHVRCRSVLAVPPGRARNVDRTDYETAAMTIVHWVGTRLLFEDLAKTADLPYIENYRLFAASNQLLNLRTFSDITRTTALFSDVMPHWTQLNLHPDTQGIVEAFHRESVPFLKRISEASGEALVKLGADWVMALCEAVTPFLPQPEGKNDEKTGQSREDRKNVPADGRLRKPGGQYDPQGEIGPLKAPQPPVLDDPRKRLLPPLGRIPSLEDESFIPDEPAEPNSKQIMDLFKIIKRAGLQQRQYEDPRSDIIENILRDRPFEPTPFEGTEVGGRQVTVKVGDKEAKGQLFDRPASLSEDLEEYERIMRDSAPLAATLKRNLYPNVQQVPECERFQTSGSLDPARLALADCVPGVFKRYRADEQLDERGRPVLLLACDASGSLDEDQMKMVKNLAAAWMSSTAHTNIKLIAGLYHSGNIHTERDVPLVQWIFHPEKTPALGRIEAIRALASLPAKGTGGQRDALSLSFMIDEAMKTARGSNIYMVCLTDTVWNRSFRETKDGRTEVEACFESAYEDLGSKLHVTLVALGQAEETGFENKLDAVFRFTNEELLDPAGTAQKISEYVAQCIRSRTGLISRSR